MKTTIKNLSNESLEQNIANIYWSAAKEAPGVHFQEETNPLLRGLWEEFDERFAAGTIDRDSDYTEDGWDD